MLGNANGLFRRRWMRSPFLCRRLLLGRGGALFLGLGGSLPLRSGFLPRFFQALVPLARLLRIVELGLAHAIGDRRIIVHVDKQIALLIIELRVDVRDVKQHITELLKRLFRAHVEPFRQAGHCPHSRTPTYSNPPFAAKPCVVRVTLLRRRPHRTPPHPPRRQATPGRLPLRRRRPPTRRRS